MDTIIQEPLSDSPTPITLIWLHGMGVDGSDFESFQKELSQFGNLDNIRVILPTAPKRVLTAYNMTLNAWYDFFSENFDDQEKEDYAGMDDAVETINQIIKEQRSAHPESPIWVGGFSQGAAIALLTGLSETDPIAGVIALSGYAPQHPRLSELSNLARQTPIFMAHGTLDPVISIAQARASLERLNKAGASVEFAEYPMMHEICPDEVSDIGDFIRAHSVQLKEGAEN